MGLVGRVVVVGSLLSFLVLDWRTAAKLLLTAFITIVLEALFAIQEIKQKKAAKKAAEEKKDATIPTMARVVRNPDGSVRLADESDDAPTTTGPKIEEEGAGDAPKILGGDDDMDEVLREENRIMGDIKRQMTSKVVRLDEMAEYFRKRLRKFWQRDEAEFCSAWNKMDGGAREHLLGMLVLNIAKGANPSGYAIPEGEQWRLAPELEDSKLKAFGKKASMIPSFIPLALEGSLENDEEFLKGRREHFEGLTIKTGANLKHDISYRASDPDGGASALKIFAVVRRMLILEVLATLMELTLGKNHKGESTGRDALAYRRK
mmetsp:Transcript_34940/g.75599  ORF Transcript_34940/g.75599 Transcript_34940/m.75599 type:complete len:319 (-) Transcript_34940:30-986(-)